MKCFFLGSNLNEIVAEIGDRSEVDKKRLWVAVGFYLALFFFERLFFWHFEF